jgi:hypothetical protein
MSVRSTILSSIAGGAAGGLGGAGLLGLPTYFSNAIGFFGPERNLAPLAASFGFVLGIIPGTVIGFIVGLLRPHVLIGAIIGVAVGFLIVPGLLLAGADPYLDRELYVWASACIPIGGVIGLFVAVINRRRVAAPDETPLDRSTGRVFGSLTD